MYKCGEFLHNCKQGVTKLSNNKNETFLRTLRIQTQGCWVRSTDTSLVLCHPGLKGIETNEMTTEPDLS